MPTFNHRKIRVYQYSYYGLTLIELMLALFISSTILISLVSILPAYQKNMKLQSAILSQIYQQNKIQHLLQQEIKSAGFIGCHALTTDFYISHPSLSLTANNRIQGSDQSFTVRYASLKTNRVLNITNDHASIKINIKPLIHKDDWILISDCKHAEIAHVKNVIHHTNEQTLLLAQPLIYSYQSYAELSQLQYHRYFIDKSNVLYRADLLGRKTEITPNVEKLHFTYWENDAVGTQEKQFSEIDDWSNVIGVNITLSISGKPLVMSVMK